MSKKIIQITGMARAGKSVVIEHLNREHGYEVVSPSRVIEAEFDRSGGGTFNREAARRIGNSLRKEHGSAFIAHHAINHEAELVAVDGVRNISAYRLLESVGAIGIGLVARGSKRYERAQAADDNKRIAPNLAAFLNEEMPEMRSSNVDTMHVLTILSILPPEAIIDTTELSPEEVCEHVDEILNVGRIA